MRVFPFGGTNCEQGIFNRQSNARPRIIGNSIAVNRNYQSGDGERQTDFFNCVAWRGLGETIARYTKKGKKVAITGTIQTRTYENNQGVKVPAIDIVAQEVEFLSPKDDGDGFDDVPPASTGGERRKPTLQPMDDDSDIPF